MLSFSRHSSQLKCRVTSHSVTAHFLGDGASARMSSDLPAQIADEVFSSSIAPNVYRKTVVKMCLRRCVGIKRLTRCITDSISIERSLVGAKKRFVWRCWCPKGPGQNSACSTHQLFVKTCIVKYSPYLHPAKTS